jgi:metal-responsive CopG/Arc/MetJ family transcriptional regulator
MTGPEIQMMRPRTETVSITVRFPAEIVELIDELKRRGHFISRAEAIRYFVQKGAVEYYASIVDFERRGESND